MTDKSNPVHFIFSDPERAFAFRTSLSEAYFVTVEEGEVHIVVEGPTAMTRARAHGLDAREETPPDLSLEEDPSGIQYVREKLFEALVKRGPEPEPRPGDPVRED